MYTSKIYTGTASAKEYLEYYVDTEKFIKYCKECPNYGKIWSCPEYDFKPEELWRKYEWLQVYACVITPDYESMKETMIAELKRNFRPEFINRIDDIIVFHKLVPEDISKIARLMIKTVSKRLAEREIYLDFTDEAAELLSKQGFDEEYGARPLRRVIQQTVEDELSERILDGSIKFGDKVRMTAKDGKIEFELEKEPAEK